MPWLSYPSRMLFWTFFTHLSFLSWHRFEENQKFPDRIGFFETTLALPNGTWELRVTAPNNGVVGTASRSLSGASTESYVEQTLASFGSCVPDEVSDLAACRGVRPLIRCFFDDLTALC